MPSSPQMIEMVNYHLKRGVNLEIEESSDPSQAVQTFIQLNNLIKARKGFIRQFWGHEFEHPHLFCWSIDWNSFEHHTVFTNSEEHTSFKAGLSQLFDLEMEAPVTLFIHIVNSESATTAFRSGVTEVAFFILQTRPDEDTMAAISEGSVDSLRQVETIGKATGSTIGWVFDAVPHSLLTSADSLSHALFGVFGYASINVHNAWRETPEGQKAGQKSAANMRPATLVPGIGPKNGYFHVHFREGM